MSRTSAVRGLGAGQEVIQEELNERALFVIDAAGNRLELRYAGVGQPRC